MKKMAKTIAMLLVLVLLASSFTGCTLIGGAIWAMGVTDDWWPMWAGMIIDVVAFFVLGVVLLIEAPDDTGVYLSSAQHYPYSAMEKFNSLPEAEKIAFMEKINSLPEEKRASMFEDIYSLPEAEVAASMERVNAMSAEDISSAMQRFSTLNETEMASFMEALNERANSSPKADYVVLERRMAPGLVFSYAGAY